MMDRLPAVTASQVLQSGGFQRKGISTNLSGLDTQLCPNAPPAVRGIPRGQVTEVYGPPGVGKTAFALQVASTALHAGEQVVWIDTGSPLPGPRLRSAITTTDLSCSANPSVPNSAKQTPDIDLSRLTYFDIPTLSHLLVLFLHSTENFPPPATSLIIVDTVSGPISTSFPKPPNQDANHLNPGHRKAVQVAMARKAIVAGDLGAGMANMAGLKNIAVLALSQCVTAKEGSQLCLKSAIAFDEWKAAVQNRLALWRDVSVPDTSSHDTSISQIRVVEIIKSNRKVRVAGQDGRLFPFVIEGVSPLHRFCRQTHLAESDRQRCERSERMHRPYSRPETFRSQ